MKVKLYGAKSKMMKVYFKVPPKKLNIKCQPVKIKYWIVEEIRRGKNSKVVS